MSNQNQEWVGGKQVYPAKSTKEEKPKTDDWLSEFSDEDLGIVGNGFKPKKNFFKVENKEKEDEENDSI